MINKNLCTKVYFSNEKPNSIKIANAFSSGSALLFGGNSHAYATIDKDYSIVFILGRVDLNKSDKILSGLLVWEKHVCNIFHSFWSRKCKWVRFTDRTKVQIPIKSILYTQEILLKDKLVSGCDGSFNPNDKFELNYNEIGC